MGEDQEMTRTVYFWFQGADPKRIGGPWWAETFYDEHGKTAEIAAQQFVASLRQFLRAYVITEEALANITADGVAPPPGAPVPILDMGTRIECDCCGRAAAQSRPGEVLHVYDGQPLACGCNGHISVDAESEPYVIVDNCSCEEDVESTCQ